MGVLGDWGTGQPEAQAVLNQLMLQQPDLIIHVGDVYYAGTLAEQTAVVEMIQKARDAFGRNIPVYTLPGNHDYYSGGEAFYQKIRLLNQGVPSAAEQTHSFWCLRNDAWQLQGMDTGYHDSDLLEIGRDITWLRDDEAAWHQRQLVDAGDRRVILFSHHQLFSAFEKIGGEWQNPFLTKNLQAWENAAGLRPSAWLWGHEHVLSVYETPGTLPVLGRCVGNSAIPVFTTSELYDPKPGGAPLQQADRSSDGKIRFPRGFVQTTADEGLWDSGFALLRLAPDGTATESYWQVKFEGDLSKATSQCLWDMAIPDGKVTW